MSDLEQELRRLLETKSKNAAIEPEPAPPVLRRARRRQFGTAFAGIVVVASVVLVAALGLRAVVQTDAVRPRPGEPPVLPHAADGYRPAVLPFASITYPRGWDLLAFDEGPKVLQLTNFDPDFTTPCVASGAQVLPPLGAILLIERLPEADASLPTWPVALHGRDSETDWNCRGAQEQTFGEPELYQASWREGTTSFVARAAIGPLARPDVRRLVSDSFGSLAVIDGDRPQTEALFAATNLFLDATTTPIGPVTLYAYKDDFEGGSAWIGIAGPIGSHLAGAGQIGRDVPSADENVTMSLAEWGGVVWGVVASSVTQTELRTVEGSSFRAKLLPLPSSLGVEGQQVVWGIVEGRTADRVTTLLYDAEGRVLNTYYPTRPREVIASGVDPEGGAWDLYLDHTDQGTGLGFAFEVGGGGGGCCLQPLEGDLALDGVGSGSGEPGNITALASENVERVVFESVSGDTIEGQVFAVPDEMLGIPKIALVIVPTRVPIKGTVIGYDVEGGELGRAFVGDIGEPPGPTADIDAVWTLLRDARDAIQRWAGHHGGSLADLDVDEARSSMRDIAWNGSGPGKPVPHEVSLRGVTRAGGSELTGWSGWTVAIVSATSAPDGSARSTYCIAVNIDENGGGNFRYGVQDAASYEECRGGWPELSG